MIEYPIKNRHTNEVQFMAKINCEESVEDTFDMDNFCSTSKGIAGWLCTQAGEKGLSLVMASDPELEVLPDYYGTNGEALIYMKRMVEKR